MNKKRFLRLFLGGAAFVSLCGILLWWVIPWFWPLPENLGKYKPPGAVILDRTGEPLAHLAGRDYYRGSWLDWGDIPEDYIKATLAAEDKRFFSHGGMDVISLARAMKSNISAGRIVSGASTITQQTVKLSSPKGKRDVWVKFREFFQARHLEMTHSKEEILYEYFQRLDYGNLREGPIAAARFYFGKPLNELSLAESALLVSLPQAPSRLNPVKYPERALKRRNWVLDRLESEFNYPKDQIERAKTEVLVFQQETTEVAVAPHLMSKLLWRGVSGEIRTTLDGDLQRAVESVVKKEWRSLRKKGVTQSAVLVVDNKSGDVLAWVGSANRRDPIGGLIDGVLVPRSAGSTLKPFVYELAFRKGAWAGYVFPDIPTQYRSHHGVEAPKNFNNRYRGPLTVREALACSQNIPAMRALDFAGGEEKLIAYLKELGFETVNDSPGSYGLGLAIGNAEVRLLDLVKAYAMMARQGKTLSLQLCKESADILGISPEKELMSREHAYVLTDILSDKKARIRGFGLNSPLNLGFPCAVKTGTSSDFRDNWCVGYTPSYTVGVWVGNFDFSRMQGISGVSGAGPIFSQVMQYLHDNRKVQEQQVERPDGVAGVIIDVRSGKRCEEEDFVKSEFKAREWAFRGHLPASVEKREYDGQGRYILNAEYSDWYESSDNDRKDAYALDKAKRTDLEKFKITSPVNGSRIFLDPELPGGGRKLLLKVNTPGAIEWSCSSLDIIEDNNNSLFLLLEPGKHEIKAFHKEWEEECKSVITVLEL